MASPLKAISNTYKRMVHPRQQGWNLWNVAGQDVNYSREVGDGTNSSTVMAPLNWIGRTFPAAPIEINKVLTDGQEELVTGHDLVRLLHRPNPAYTGKLLWQATAMDYYVDGNAYWLKLRNRTKGVSELWWVPSSMIEPMESLTDESVFIDYYSYKPNGAEVKLSPDDVVHFRYGIDPDNQRKGRSPMKSVLREVFSDDEAAKYTASILRNMGVPGIIISPKDGNTDIPNPKDLKESIDKGVTGTKKGSTFVATAAVDIEQFGFSPEQMNLKELRRVPEERVTAVLGIPAIVCGLGAGLDRSTFANFSEARKAAYESNIIPAQEVMAEDIRFQLLPDFEVDPMAWNINFDLSGVRILQEDENKLAERMNIGVANGWIKRSEARRELGLEAEDYDEVYLMPLNLTETVPGEEKEENPLAPLLPIPPTEETEEPEKPEQLEEDQNAPEKNEE